MTKANPARALKPDDLKPMAIQSLDAFEKVASEARGRIEARGGHVPDVLTTANTVNDMKGLISIGQIRHSEQQDHRTLANTPVTARIVCVDKSGKRQVFFISPVASALTRIGEARVASYRAQIGRIASLPVGSTFSLPSSASALKVIEREEFRTRYENAEWDARDTRVEAEGGVALTVHSLRDLLRGIVPLDEVDPLDAILAGEAAAENVVEGFRRERLQRLSLREKPILDSFQDEAFRLPLARRVVLMGPPGTGKTTTLIKRLGQKLDPASLDEEEKEQVRASRAGADEHARSWRMFSPTDLLKVYVKEAFNQEGIPAPDENIQTWDRFRDSIARGELRILRSGAGSGVFFLREHLEALLPDAIERSPQWFEAFDAWHRNAFWADLRERASRLADSSDAPVRAIGQRLQRLLPQTGAETRPRIGPLLDGSSELSDRVDAIESQVDRIARKAVSAAFKQDQNFLLDFGKQVEIVSERASTEADELDEEEEDDETEVAATPRTGQQAAFIAYRRLVKQAAQAAAAKRSPRAVTRLGRLLKWLRGRIPSDVELEALGKQLQAQADLRAFLNPARRFLDHVPRRYRAFRREAEGQGDWYKPGTLRARDITPLELDIVTLGMLRIVRELLDEPRVAARLDEKGFEFLALCAHLQRTQIVADEATDFSPVQLACMASLCDPTANSFFACGDFRQRMTRWGSRSQEDLAWVFSDIEIKEINVTYRQSRLLNDFSHRIAGLAGGAGALPLLPPKVRNEGVAPVLGVALVGHSAAADWLARRINEIERLSPPLPTVAVVVPSEDDVEPLADALNDVLSEQNLRATACVGGRFIGEGNEIRVFDVRHIKGLEFEAVFFVGLDRLVDLEPDLYDKYLYVGATRAATYLGVTVAGSSLPVQLRDLRKSFETDWRAR